MNERRLGIGGVLVVLSAIVIMTSSTAFGQTGLEQMVEEGDMGWLMGSWKATTDEGVDIDLVYRWQLEKNAIGVYFKMDEQSYQGMIFCVPGKEEVVELGVDNKGNTVKVEWDASWDGAVSKRTITKADGGTEGVGITYSKIDKDTMKVELFGMEYGYLSSQSMGSINFKRQSQQRRRRTSTETPESALSRMVEEGDTNWLFGRWKATTDEGMDISLAYQWRLDKNMIAVYFRMGEHSYQGMISCVPGKEEVAEFGVDNEGNTVKVAWDASWDGLVSKRSITKANGDTEGMGVVYSKVDKDTMKVEVFGMEYGNLSSQSMGSLNFKRQPMQRRTRTRSTSAESR